MTSARKEPRWRERNSIIESRVLSDGTTGPQWMSRKGLRADDHVRRILHSSDFRPTTGVETRIAIVKGSIFTDGDRFVSNIRAFAARRALIAPNPEVACLIREKFTDKEIEDMGLCWILTMHKPVIDPVGGPSLLFSGRLGGGPWMYAYDEKNIDTWDCNTGFVFAIPPIVVWNR